VNQWLVLQMGANNSQVEFLKALSMVVACKGLPCACGSPACTQLLCGTELEAADVGTDKGNSRHASDQH